MHYFQLTTVRAIRELKRRWAAVDSCLRARQPAPIRRVTRQRDIGLFALLCLLASWGDPTLPQDFLFGVAAVGTAPWYGVFPLQASREIPPAEVLQDTKESNSQVRASRRPSKDDDSLLEQSLKDAAHSLYATPSCYGSLRVNLSCSYPGASLLRAAASRGLLIMPTPAGSLP